MGYQSLSDAEDRLSAAIQYVRKMPKLFMALAASAFLLAVFALTRDGSAYAAAESYLPSSPITTKYSPTNRQNPLYYKTQNRRFAIVIPATSPSPNLCKSLMTGIALGYPSQVIVNWGKDFRKVSKWGAGQNLLKVPGVLEYLDYVLRPDAHPNERLDDDDLILVADGNDAWFQLPPEVMLKRYHAANERANKRLYEQWPHNEPMPMEQTIIAATQKKCHPNTDYNTELHCDMLPQSTLREDLYGPDTDKNASDYHTVRPRFINGGVYLGTVGDMRRMFRRGLSRLQARVDAGFAMASEQGVTGEVLGEQEVWRQLKRESNMTAGGNLTELTDVVDAEFEYHIGLDYRQEISIATVFEEDDGIIFPLGNKTAINDNSERRGISPPRLTGVPADVKDIKNPLEGIVKEPKWDDMPLYADFYTEAVPAILHHNAHRNGAKSRRISWWDQTWYFPHFRQLLTSRLQPREQQPLATVHTQEGLITYWPVAATWLKRRPRLMSDTFSSSLPEMDFETLCRDSPDKNWWDEIFRDGKGAI